jgi:hypothetical protein
VVVVVNPNTQRPNQNGQVNNQSDFGSMLRALIERSTIPVAPKLPGRVPADPGARAPAMPGRAAPGDYVQRDGGRLLVQPDGRQIRFNAFGEVISDTGPQLANASPQGPIVTGSIQTPQPVATPQSPVSMPVPPPAAIRSNTIDRSAPTPGNPTNPRGAGVPNQMGALKGAMSVFGDFTGFQPTGSNSEKPFQLGTVTQTPTPVASTPKPVTPSPFPAMSAAIKPVAGAASTGKRTAASVGGFLSRAASAVPVGAGALSALATAFAPSLAVAKAATLNPKPQPKVPAAEPLRMTIRKAPAKAKAPTPGKVVVPGNPVGAASGPGGGPSKSSDGGGSAWGVSGSRPTGGGAGGERTGARSFYGK